MNILFHFKQSMQYRLRCLLWSTALAQHYILRMFLLFSLTTRPHFLRRQKTDIPETFPYDVA